MTGEIDFCGAGDTFLSAVAAATAGGFALADAARCGVAVIASAHGESLEGAALRPALREILDSGAIRLVALLGGRPGSVAALRRVDWAKREGAAWSFA